MPRSSREKSVETRANIVDAAYRLFLERGYSATAMRDISQSAGVTVGAIYNHFPTKEDVWKEVLISKHPYHEILPLIYSAEGETIADLIRSAARAVVRELLKRPDLFNLMFIEIVEFKGEHISHLIQTIFPAVLPLAQLFQGKRGRLRDIPIPVILRSFIGLFFSYYLTGNLLKDIPGMTIDEESLEQFVNLYLYGILAPDAKEDR
jgi:AcrR family transcriptional regulator